MLTSSDAFWILILTYFLWRHFRPLWLIYSFWGVIIILNNGRINSIHCSWSLRSCQFQRRDVRFDVETWLPLTSRQLFTLHCLLHDRNLRGQTILSEVIIDWNCK
jgi:hypothetical protein